MSAWKSLKVKRFNFWNRKLHIHIGLFLLLFIWLFSFSGLLLNHGGWKFASFWEERIQEEFTAKVFVADPRDSVAVIRDVMRGLDIEGEVTNVKYAGDGMDFRVGSPGRGAEVHVDFSLASVRVKAYRLNIWGRIRTLHTFNGVDKAGGEKPSNWLITSVWRFAMDGIAVALVFLCISSWVMWFKIRKDYVWGSVMLIAGFSTCLYFVYLLQFF